MLPEQSSLVGETVVQNKVGNALYTRWITDYPQKNSRWKQEQAPELKSSRSCRSRGDTDTIKPIVLIGACGTDGVFVPSLRP
jgi:hypothetical protein